MNKTEALNILKNSPIFWSRLGFCYDPPLLDDTGKIIVFNPEMTEVKSHASFSEAGIRIHTCVLHSGWVGVDRYDYSLCDRVLEKIFTEGKAEYFVPRVKLNVPVDWCYENPTEITVYEDGPRNAEAIRALVGTLRQDYLGYESPCGYYNANGWQDTRPNVGGLISLQSFSSEKWLQDAGEALRRLVKHLEESPYGDRILAYHIAYGACGETMLWGRQSGKFGDYGISHQERFHRWGLARYGSESALSTVWRGYGEKDNGDIVPPSLLREKKHPKSDDFYKKEEIDHWSLDYDRFMCEVNTDAIDYFGKIVKEMTDDKPVGSFYGYVLYMARTAYAGHLGWKRLLDSPYIDFFAAPKSYYRCAPGEPGGEMAPAVSVNRKKLWVDECDNRTHLARADRYANATCLEDTYCVLLRELCKNISHDSGLCYMDLGGGWYDNQELMNYIVRLMDASDKIRKISHESVSEIAVFVDEESILHTHPDVTRPLEELLRKLQLAGAPLDVRFFYDVGEVDLSSIKLAVLLTPWCLCDRDLKELRSAIAKDGHILFCGKIQADTGIDMEDMSDGSLPQYRILPGKNMKPLFQNEAGEWIGAKNDRGDYVISSPEVTTVNLRQIAEDAGVTCYAPTECTVYADNRIVSFFAREDQSFIPNGMGKGQWFNVLTREPYVHGETLSLLAKRGVAFALRRASQ